MELSNTTLTIITIVACALPFIGATTYGAIKFKRTEPLNSTPDSQ